MSVFSAAGELLAPRGALRVVTLAPQEESPVQLLVTNDGVAPARITVSLRADPPAPASPPPPSPVPGLQPEPGAAGQPPASESPLPLDRDRGLPRNRGSDAPEAPADGTEAEAEGEPATRP
jgi:serine/threonine-protein kinase